MVFACLQLSLLMFILNISIRHVTHGLEFRVWVERDVEINFSLNYIIMNQNQTL